MGDGDRQGGNHARQDLRALALGAHKEWLCAINLFQEAVEPDLIDRAIYLMDAAERRYVYLLRAIREQEGRPMEAPVPERVGEA